MPKLLLLLTLLLAQSAPKVTLSTVRVSHPGHLEVRGAGFTPKGSVSSHLKRPDGTEFPVLPIMADNRGEFTHDIDTLLLYHGTHELWVVDDTSKVSSNVAKFEVTLEQK